VEQRKKNGDGELSWIVKKRWSRISKMRRVVEDLRKVEMLGQGSRRRRD
jgi:hypothetical protein